MSKSRIVYFILITVTILTGLLSRHYSFMPLFIGDILWALMVYFIMRFLFIGRSIKFAGIASVIFCFAIEFSQLCQAPWINGLRQTILGKLILGQGFLWTDLVCYLAGICLGLLIDKLWQKTN